MLLGRAVIQCPRRGDDAGSSDDLFVFYNFILFPLSITFLATNLIYLKTSYKYSPRMPTDLPYAAEAESSLSPDELEVLRRQYYREIEQGHVTIQSKFNYGKSLLSTVLRKDSDCIQVGAS